MRLTKSGSDWRTRLTAVELARGNAGRTSFFVERKKEALQARIDAHDKLRRAIQQHSLCGIRPISSIWIWEVELRKRMVGLTERSKDVVWFLGGLCDNKDVALRESERDLMSSVTDLMASILIYAQLVADFKTVMRSLRRLCASENPKKTRWEVKQRAKQKNGKKKRIACETRRRLYIASKAALPARSHNNH